MKIGHVVEVVHGRLKGCAGILRRIEESNDPSSYIIQITVVSEDARRRGWRVGDEAAIKYTEGKWK